MKRLGHGADVTVLENKFPMLASSPEVNLNHRSGQIVSPNHLVREQYPKRGIDCAQQTVTEIRFFPWLDGVDVRGPEDVNAEKPNRKKSLLGLSFVACERNPTSPARGRASPAQE